MQVTRYYTDHAWLGGDRTVAGVVIEVIGDRITAVHQASADTTAPPSNAVPPPNTVHLRGVTLPGLANAHSHAFHRALRGRTQRERGTFWTWREQMYAVAARLTPDRYHALARAVYAEMVLAGVTSVGEFHYVHHDTGGRPYASANAMSEALIAAAADAGIRITLLDTCYLRGGFDTPLKGPQLRFGDRDADPWAERAAELKDERHARIGAAIHSVRAVPARQVGAEPGGRVQPDPGPADHDHLPRVPRNCARIAAHSPTGPEPWTTTVSPNAAGSPVGADPLITARSHLSMTGP
jgi:formiminoglutamate deiminase